MNHPAGTGAQPWCAVFASRDLAPQSVVPVMAAGQAIALWRSAQGRVHAWLDRCPHRGMRLALGAVSAGGLVCPYHGWRFGDDAQCNYIPAHPGAAAPATARARPFEAVERGGYVWVAPAGADQAALPVLPDGLEPLRSLYLRAGAARAAEAWRRECGGLPLVALAQPVDDGSCMLHLACAGPLPAAERLALNRAAVAFRRALQSPEDRHERA